MTRRALVALLAVPLLVLAACGGDDDGAGLTAEVIADKLQDEGDLDAETAGCMGDAIADELGPDALADLDESDLEGEEPPSAEFEDAFDAALSECLLTGDGDTDGEDTDGGDTDGEDAAGDAAMPQEVCAAWSAWSSTGDDAALVEFRTAVEATGRDDIIEAIDALETQETDTADGQAAYEGAYDFIEAELQIGGCPPSRAGADE